MDWQPPHTIVINKIYQQCHNRSLPTRNNTLKAALTLCLFLGTLQISQAQNLTSTRLETEVNVAATQKRLYQANCAVCHKADGTGDQAFPPLAKSEWVSGDKEILIKMQLLGLSGPIKVRGKMYDGIPMPSSSHLKDADLAHILTYIRTSPLFGNNSSEVFEAEIMETRAKIADHTTPLDARTLRHPDQPVPNKTPQLKQDNESTSYLTYLIGFIILCFIPVVIGLVRNNKPTTK